MKKTITLAVALALIMAASLPLAAQPRGRERTPEDFTKLLKSVKTKIEMTSDQENAISELYRDYAKARKEIMTSHEADGEKDGQTLNMALAKLNMDAHRKVESILDLTQMKEFRAITRDSRKERRESARNEHTEELIGLLGVSGDDEAKVRSILEGQREKMRSMMEGRRGRAGGRDRMDGMREKMEKISGETGEKLEKVLSTEQMDIYRKYIEEQRETMRGNRPRSKKRR